MGCFSSWPASPVVASPPQGDWRRLQLLERLTKVSQMCVLISLLAWGWCWDAFCWSFLFWLYVYLHVFVTHMWRVNGHAWSCLTEAFLCRQWATLHTSKCSKGCCKERISVGYRKYPRGVWFRWHTWPPLHVADLISATWPSPVFLIQCLVAYISLHLPSAGGRVFCRWERCSHLGHNLFICKQLFWAMLKH